MKPRPEYIVIEHLKKFFSDPDKEKLTKEEAYAAWGRDLTQKDRNDAWFSNKTVDLRRYGYIESYPYRSREGRKQTGIRLTSKGKAVIKGAVVLQSDQPQLPSTTAPNASATSEQNGSKVDESTETEIVTEKSIVDMVEKFKQSHKNYKVKFSLSLELLDNES